jgi:hypothetical protein
MRPRTGGGLAALRGGAPLQYFPVSPAVAGRGAGSQAFAGPADVWTAGLGASRAPRR